VPADEGEVVVDPEVDDLVEAEDEVATATRLVTLKARTKRRQ
jgi:hypothetical protein